MSGTVGGTAALIASHYVTGTTLTFSTNSHAAASATITIPVTGATNYNDYAVVVTITAEDKEIVTISGLTADSDLVYNGMAHLGYTGTVMVSDKKVSTDELIYIYTSTDEGTYNSATAPTDAGSYSLVVSVAETNEDFAGEHEAIDFVIQKVLATVTADNKSKVEGELNPVFTFTSSGFVNGESITGVTFSLTGSTINPEGGTVSGGGNGNYDITYEVGTLTIRPAQEVLVETISAATTAKTGIIASDKTPGEVYNGQKFVSTALMNALNSAIEDAQQQIASGDAPSDDPKNPVLNAITALNNALQAFIDGIQVGTMSNFSGGGGGSSTIAPITQIENGSSTTSSNLNQLIAGSKTLTVVEDKSGAKLVFEPDALKEIVGQSSSEIKVEMKDVSPSHQENLPGKLVFSLTVTSGSGTISNFGSSVTVSLPYTLKEGESADEVTVWYLASDGTMTEIPCTYDKATGLATFKVTHFSLYVVGVDKSWVNPFTDVKESDWFYGSVEFVNRKGLFAGTGTDTFSPNSHMTRAMLWTVLGRLDGQSLSGSGVFEAARSWAMDAGITDGTNPDGSITREQMVTILWRYAGVPKVGADLNKFSDAGSVSSYAADAMAWAVENGIISGANGAIMPQDNATRAQVATILKRYV